MMGGPYEPPYSSYPLPPQVGRRGHTVTGILLAVAAVICLVAAVVSGLRISRELTRNPTQAERDQASAIELARRWQVWPAGKIFPQRLGYQAEAGGTENATRIAVDPSTSCAGGLDDRARPIVARYGCRAVLRATYLDQLEGLVATIGVIAFPDERSAGQAKSALPTNSDVSPGVAAYGPASTIVARFNDAARQVGAARQAGPYVVALTVGYADGRPAAAVTQRQTDLYDLASQLANPVLGPISKRAEPDCRQKEWQC